MSLTRKFYNALAADLKDARPPLGNPDETPLAVWAHCVTITANHLALNNGSFNRDRFYEACGLVRQQAPGGEQGPVGVPARTG